MTTDEFVKKWCYVPITVPLRDHPEWEARMKADLANVIEGYAVRTIQIDGVATDKDAHFLVREIRQHQLFRCSCGFETGSADEADQHLEKVRDGQA